MPSVLGQAAGARPERKASKTQDAEVGKRLLAERNWKAAAAEFERLLKTNPKDTDAHIGLGIALWASGERDAALAAFRRATEVNPASAEAHYNVALALRDVNEIDAAIAEMKRALGLRPAYDEARLALGLMLQQRGEIAAGIEQYRLVLKRNPKSAEAHNWLGVAYMQKNQLSEAIDEFRRAIQLQPNFVRAYNNLGSTLSQAGNVEEGIAAFEAGLRIAPSDIQMHLNLGTALRNKGDPEGAIRNFEIVLKSSPDDPEVHYQLGQALRQQGKLDDAIREFETALRLNAEYQDAYYILGQTLRQSAAARRPRNAVPGESPAVAGLLKDGSRALAGGDITAALELFTEAVSADPKSAAAHTARGFALGRARDLTGAIASFQKAIELNPDLADAHYNLGAAYWYSGEKAKAATELEEAIRLNPAAAEAYSLRGVGYRDAGDLDSARRMAQCAIALNPRFPAGYFDLGLVLLRMGQLNQALGQFEAGLNLPAATGPPPDLQLAIEELRQRIAEQESAEAHNVLGRMLGLAGAGPRAVIAEFEAAIRLKPELAEAHNNLGLVFMQTGNDEKAIAEFRAAIQQRSDYADAHANLGAVLTPTDAAASIAELERAVALQPGLLKAHYNLAIAYGASPAHGVDKEIETLRKLMAMDANYPRAEFALGKALLRKGAVAEALERLERAVQAEPQFGEAQYQLGLALSRSGRRDEAAAVLKKSRELIAASQKDQSLALDMQEGRAAMGKGEVDQALQKFQRVANERPDLAEAHYQIGTALAHKKDYSGAAVAFRKALELDPAHAGAKEALTRVSAAREDSREISRLESYIRGGKFQEARPLLESYLNAHPDSAWGWYALGYCYFAQREIGESIKALSKSLSLDVSNADAHKVLGRNLMLIGRFDAAKLEFELGAKYDPKSAEIQYNLGKLYSIQDEWPSAKGAFELAVRLDPSYMEAYDGLGFALESLGDDAGAIANYTKAAQMNEARKGNFAAPYVNLSALHNRAANPDAALEYAKKAVGVNPNSDRAWFQQAKALERRGELAPAVDALQRAVAINPNVSSYYYVLGTLYRKLGKQQESREAMETFARLSRESNELDQKRREVLHRDGTERE
jgi:tetratricopeptide (TPR) repeat protein